MRTLALVVLASILTGSAVAAPKPVRLLGTRGRVVRIAADGARVAAITTNIHGRCDRIVVWNASTRAVSTWDTAVDCAGGESSGGQAVTEVAVADTRVAWLEQVDGNDQNLTLKTALIGGKPKQVEFAANGNGAGGEVDGDYVGHLTGSGSQLLYNTWRVCALIPPGTEDDLSTPCANPPAQPPAQEVHVTTDERLWRLTPAKHVVAKGPTALWVVGADGNRVATQRGGGPVTVLGGSVPTIRIPDGEAAGTVFRGSTVATIRNSALEAYSTTTGELTASYPVPELDAVLRDLQGGIAVYVEGVRIHLVRLADGKRTTIVAPGHAPVDAQLEAGGLYYSYNLVGGTSPGRIAFLPVAQLRSRF